jgi:hypothetical protein
MEIVIGKFKIISTDNYYDLVEMVTRNKKVKGEDGKSTLNTGETYEGYNTICYNCTLEHCIRKIIHLMLHEKQVPLTLNEFLLEYKKIQESLKEYSNIGC